MKTIGISSHTQSQFPSQVKDAALGCLRIGFTFHELQQHRFPGATPVLRPDGHCPCNTSLPVWVAGQEQGKDMPGEKDETCGTRMAIEETGIKQVGFEEGGAFAAESISYTRPTSIYHFANERRNT